MCDCCVLIKCGFVWFCNKCYILAQPLLHAGDIMNVQSHVMIESSTHEKYRKYAKANGLKIWKVYELAINALENQHVGL